MRKWNRIALIALMLGVYSLSAQAAETRTIDGKIESIDAANKSLVVKDKKSGESLTIVDAASKPIDIYTKGAMDDAKAGETLKVYGTLQPDLSAIENVHAISVMPTPSTYTNKKNRIDGILVIEDGKWYLDRKGHRTAVTLKDKVSVSKVFRVDFAFLEKDMRLRFSAVEKDGAYAPKYDLRGFAAREKTEKYAEALKKNK